MIGHWRISFATGLLSLHVLTAAAVPILLFSSSQDPNKSPALHSWSSIIGIVTAIVGNVLISFALNIQRYAHIRLSKDNEEEEEEQGEEEEEEDSRPKGKINRGDEDGENPVDDRDEGPASQPGRSRLENGLGRAPSSRSKLDGHQGEARTGPQNASHQAFPPRRTTSYASSRHETAPLLGGGLFGGGERKTYLRSPFWWAGLVLMTIGEGGNFVAYGFAPASVVSPLGVVALISNCIIAPFMLREPFRQRDFWGVIIAVTGAVSIVVSAKTSDEKLGPDAIWHAITRWEFEVYLVVTLFLIMLGIFASHKYGERMIFIDLGVAGLFGMFSSSTSVFLHEEFQEY